MSNQPSITVIAITGELEFSRKAELRSVLVIPNGGSAVLVDFSEVSYADSTALAELLRFYSESAKANIPVAVLIKSRQFARVIEYAGLTTVFKIFDNRAEALMFLGEARV